MTSCQVVYCMGVLINQGPLERDPKMTPGK